VGAGSRRCICRRRRRRSGRRGGATKIAGDPPEPNSRYAAELEVEVPDVGDAFRQFEPLSAMSVVLDAAVRIVTYVDALSEVEGRMLGARAAGDDRGRALQLASYRDLLRLITAQSVRLMHNAPLLARALDMSTILVHKSLERRRAREGSTPSDAPELLRQGRLGGRLAALSLRIAENVAVPVANVRNVSDALPAMAGFLSLLIYSTQKNGREVLRRFGAESS
jgi:hypothetical protein